MKAAVFHGQKDVRVEEVPEPEVREGSVKVKVDWCGICGTDLHEYLAGPIFIPTAGSPHLSRAIRSHSPSDTSLQAKSSRWGAVRPRCKAETGWPSSRSSAAASARRANVAHPTSARSSGSTA